MTMNVHDRLLIELCEEQIKEAGDTTRLSAEMFRLGPEDFARAVSQLQEEGFITDAFISKPTADGEGVWFANLRNVWVTEHGVNKAKEILSGLAKSS